MTNLEGKTREETWRQKASVRDVQEKSCKRKARKERKMGKGVWMIRME